MLIRVWENTRHRASEHASVLQRAASSAHELQQDVLSEILSIIKKSRDPEELWLSLHRYKSPQECEGISSTLKSTPSWKGSYFGRIEDHYSALRRFLPDWYRLVSLSATTADDAIPQAQAFAKEHAESNQTELPIEGCPVEFLRPLWDRKAVKRFGRTGRIVRVQKAPFELGLLDATVQGLQKRTVAISGGRRYAPMIDHLLPRDDFLLRFEEHVRRLGLPAGAAEYYAPRYARLGNDLEEIDRDYQATEDKFWVNRNGTLGYSRVPGQSFPPRLKRLKGELARAVPEVSIFDVLLDCQRWTGFMDVFQPASGRQNMSETERLRHLLAALYAYG